jgi:hypothetical protein
MEARLQACLRLEGCQVAESAKMADIRVSFLQKARGILFVIPD